MNWETSSSSGDHGQFECRAILRQDRFSGRQCSARRHAWSLSGRQGQAPHAGQSSSPHSRQITGIWLSVMPHGPTTSGRRAPPCPDPTASPSPAGLGPGRGTPRTTGSHPTRTAGWDARSPRTGRPAQADTSGQAASGGMLLGCSPGHRTGVRVGYGLPGSLLDAYAAARVEDAVSGRKHAQRPPQDVPGLLTAPPVRGEDPPRLVIGEPADRRKTPRGLCGLGHTPCWRGSGTGVPPLPGHDEAPPLPRHEADGNRGVATGSGQRCWGTGGITSPAADTRPVTGLAPGSGRAPSQCRGPAGRGPHSGAESPTRPGQQAVRR